MSSTVASNSDAYAIGEPGKPWGIADKKEWRDTRVKQRSYFEDVVPRVQKLQESNKDLFEVTQYGDLPHYKDSDNGNENADGYEYSCKAEAFPLFAIRTRNWAKDKPNVLITGGVHGYETSGVEGALMFLEQSAEGYSKHFNIVVAPCVSPWGYERIQRWNAYAVDPNRSFNPDGEIVEGRSFNPEAATEESAALIKYLREDIKELAQNKWICHLDLHETTDTDETEFRPAKSARDGDTSEPGEIPDGFYLVQDETSMKPEWFTAMIERVRTVTHIAPSDADGNLIGEKVSQEGVIKIPSNRLLGLCAGVTDAPYRTTTEVYPDSKNATPEECNRAQVACIEGALDYIVKHDLVLGATAKTATALEQN